MNEREREETGYAVAKQVPDMSRGFVIQTSYGDLVIHADEAEPVRRVVQQILQKRLRAGFVAAE